MRKFQKALVAIASASMVLGTMGMAGAASAGAKPASAPACVTRAQFIYDFDVAAGIMPVYPATSDFSDVAPSSPYYGYVEAATKAGILSGVGNGKFDPAGCLTRAQIAKIEVLALGDGTAAASDMTQATTFTDDSSIPAWARGYIVEAVKLGLVHGFPNGSYGPNSDMTAADESFFLAQYKSIENALTLIVTASATSVAAGQQVTLTSTGTSEPVAYTTTTGAVISGNVFVGSTPGTYTVTGATASGLTGTVQIAVYGAATALKVSTPSVDVVANGASTETVTVAVVDANGNSVVNDSTDQITLASSNPGVAFVNGGGTAMVVNGVATFTLTAGTIPGSATTLTASASGFTNATATVTSTAQVATSLSVSAPQYVEANDSLGSGTLSVEVDDQTGNPMLFGTYAISASLTGAAKFPDGTTGPESGAYASGHDATFTFDTIQSETGAITFTVTGTGLTSGTATSTAVIAGSPTALQATPSGTTFAETASTNFVAGDQGTSGNNVTIQTGLVDSHGYPTGLPSGNVTITVTMAGSAADLAYSTNGGATWSKTNDGTATFQPGPDGSFMLADTQAGADVGTYTVSVTDSTDGVTAASPITLTETPGPAAQIALSPDNTKSYVTLPVTSPKLTWTAQAEDAYGNSVAEGGLPITFESYLCGTGTYTIGTTQGDNSDCVTGEFLATATTGADGSATVDMVGQPYHGNDYWVQAETPNLNESDYVDAEVWDTVATSLTVQTFSNNTFTTETNQFEAGKRVYVLVTVTDQYNSSPENGNCNDFITVSAYGSTVGTPHYDCYGPNSNQYKTSFIAGASGAVTVSAADASSLSGLSGQTVIAVTPGAFAGWEWVDASGNVVGSESVNPSFTPGAFDTASLSVSANTPVELWLKPIDKEGNPVVLTPADVTSEGGSVLLSAPAGTGAGAAGAFRLSASGSDVSSDTLTAGEIQIPIWYVNTLNQTGLNFDSAAQ